MASFWYHSISGQVAGMKRPAPPERRERKKILMGLCWQLGLVVDEGRVAYKDDGMLFVHQVLTKPRHELRYTTICESPIKRAEDMGDVYPYQAVKEADRSTPIAC
jgi:hypothetical protein